MERQQLYSIIHDQQKDFRREIKIIDREKSKQVLPLIKARMPITITGLRRCGKSTLLKIIKNELKLQNDQYLYINFNDERLLHFSIDDFQKIVDYLHEHHYQEPSFLFLDEVQEAEGWEKWVDRVSSQFHIILTGSNSKLLSREISTVLTGRTLSFELFPFSFYEYAIARQIEMDNWQLDIKQQNLLRAAFHEYLVYGGMPQFVMTGVERIISELYENILFRDIITRHARNLIKPVKEIGLYMCTNPATLFSFRQLAKMVDMQNISTVKSITQSLEASYLFLYINKFDMSVKKQVVNPRKLYVIDNGFIRALGVNFSKNYGNLLENLVAIELLRRNQEIFYYANKFECDFITRQGTEITQAIQVTWELQSQNEKREIDGLLETMKKFKLTRGLIITSDQEKELKIDNHTIVIEPAWKWMLKQVDRV